MRFHVLTLFPEMIMSGLENSILKRAKEKGLIDFTAINIRDFAGNKHNSVDDYTYGGGAGMLMQAQPVYEAYQNTVMRIEKEREGRGVKQRVIYVTPQGRTFDQSLAEELSQEEDIIFICGHYEGIDDRVLEEIVTDNVSIGDYVLTGGELPAMVMIDSIARLVPGVLNNDISADTESFQNGLLEYPQYTRPEKWHDVNVPAVLLSGDHAKVEAWRLQESIKRTRQRRPDLYEAYKKQIIEEEKQKKPKQRKLTAFIKALEGEEGEEAILKL